MVLLPRCKTRSHSVSYACCSELCYPVWSHWRKAVGCWSVPNIEGSVLSTSGYVLQLPWPAEESCEQCLDPEVPLGFFRGWMMNSLCPFPGPCRGVVLCSNVSWSRDLWPKLPVPARGSLPAPSPAPLRFQPSTGLPASVSNCKLGKNLPCLCHAREFPPVGINVYQQRKLLTDGLMRCGLECSRMQPPNLLLIRHWSHSFNFSQ